MRLEWIGALMIGGAAFLALRKARFDQAASVARRFIRLIQSEKNVEKLTRLEVELERAGISRSEARTQQKRPLFFAAGGLCVSLLLASFGAPAYIVPALTLSGAIYPRAALGRKIRQRKREIFLALPYYLDLLALSLEAGLDLLASIEEIASRDSDHPLREELLITLKSVRMGSARSNAFFQLAERTGVDPLRLLASSVAQSEELGSGLGALFRLQSENLRREIFRDAEERAHRAPLRMLAPLVLLIFPVVFMLLFAPIAFHFLGVR